MYIPAHFEESRIEVLHDLMRTHPLATLITMSSDGINANHVPLLLIQELGQYGTLRGHVARANPIWTDLLSNVEALVIFHGTNHYITPSWYPTKHEHGKVVPTWNYVVVHAYGTLRIIDDAVWIKNQLESLTTQYEASFDKPWAVSDAPAEFTNQMINAIIGIEISVTKLVGKWKVSQNQPTANQTGVVKGLKRLDDLEASKMASLIENISQNAR
ncbi:MAG: FMN-binding negative transcriptional regulator [Methylotenera sp.]|nr:FMN-binding negative transcriptional regulator [Methylotenera sp.]